MSTSKSTTLVIIPLAAGGNYLLLKENEDGTVSIPTVKTTEDKPAYEVAVSEIIKRTGYTCITEFLEFPTTISETNGESIKVIAVGIDDVNDENGTPDGYNWFSSHSAETKWFTFKNVASYVQTAMLLLAFDSFANMLFDAITVLVEQEDPFYTTRNGDYGPVFLSAPDKRTLNALEKLFDKWKLEPCYDMDGIAFTPSDNDNYTFVIQRTTSNEYEVEFFNPYDEDESKTFKTYLKMINAIDRWLTSVTEDN